ncbi:hypothetical protein AVEN_58472-1 [Araneus ventricosus]|uniref:Uncharacterized protein n=1 Tax=Araneus ventricosus TaxID=182803 RepID=A0A4Y2SI38_ARAVE|nr:hypothetical protein AVEN_58472-1 [Araneus ventricosus]
MHLLKQVLMMLQCLLHLSPTWSLSLELKAGVKLYGSFHRRITGIRVLDQVAVYQLTAAEAIKQLSLASLVSISEVCLSLIILSVLRSAQNVLQNKPHLIIFLHAWGFPNRILFLILY